MKKEQIAQINEQLIGLQDAVLYKGEYYTYFDSGLTRKVFVNKDKTKIIKFLIDSNSTDFNQEEYNVYKNANDSKKLELAETKISGNIIEQEYVSNIKDDNRHMTIPQIMFANSCRGEVGWTKDGRLVCFDLSEYKLY